MRYTLYVGENCHQCADVLEFMESEQIEFEKINVDHTDKKPPIPLFAFPALFENEELMCYGSDIINYLKKK